jgi:hypothetical protein
MDLARLWCAFRATDAVSSGHLPAPTPQGGRQGTTARGIRGLRCIRLRCVTLAMLSYVLVGLQYSAAAYITALAIDFFTVVFGFVVAPDVIMQQPIEVSERPMPH